MADTDGQEECCRTGVRDNRTVKMKNSRGQRFSDSCPLIHHITATCCFGVHFGAIWARHFARNKGFSAFLLIQAGFKQHGASQWDGTSEKKNKTSIYQWPQQNVLLVRAFCANKNILPDFDDISALLCAPCTWQNAPKLTKQFFSLFLRSAHSLHLIL